MVKRLARLAAAGFALILAVGASGAGYLYYYAHSPVESAGDNPVRVAKGSSFQSVLATLQEQGWIERRAEMHILGRALGVAAHIHAGEYRFEAGQTPRQMLRALATGDVLQHSVTLPEGWTVDQFLARLRATDTLDASRLPDGPRDPDLLAWLDLAERFDSAEGWLFPETYRFSRGTDARLILRQAHERMRRQLADAWGERYADLPLESAYQALILASIVEKETAAPGERGRIAGVFINRLREGMRLQTDPTVIYGLGDAFDGNLTEAHLRRETPYNTYRVDGLPPTPIANPGEKALRVLRRHWRGWPPCVLRDPARAQSGGAPLPVGGALDGDGPLCDPGRHRWRRQDHRSRWGGGGPAGRGCRGGGDPRAGRYAAGGVHPRPAYRRGWGGRGGDGRRHRGPAHVRRPRPAFAQPHFPGPGRRPLGGL